MTLILSNNEIDELVSMEECIERLDQTYQDLGNGLAQNRPRSDIYGPIQDDGRYVFKTMDGLAPRFEAAAIRLNSDTIRWSITPAGIRKDKTPTGPGGKWIGLVLVFSTRTGEPLAIMPDGSDAAIARRQHECVGGQVYDAARRCHVCADRGRMASKRPGHCHGGRSQAEGDQGLQSDPSQS